MAIKFADTFTDTAATTLANHTPDTDTTAAGWTPYWDLINTATGLFINPNGNAATAEDGVDNRSMACDPGISDLTITNSIYITEKSSVATISTRCRLPYLDATDFSIRDEYQFIFAQYGPTSLTGDGSMQKVVGGVFTALNSFPNGYAPTNYTDPWAAYGFSVDTTSKGSLHEVSVDGTFLASATDASNTTETGAAIYCRQQGTAPNTTVPYYEDISIADALIATAVLTGTVTASITEADIVAGGKTIILTVTDDTLVPIGAAFDATRQDLLDLLDGLKV